MSEIYKPNTGLRNHQFDGIPDICNLAGVMAAAKQDRINEVIGGK